jgi:hypothetical protein
MAVAEARGLFENPNERERVPLEAVTRGLARKEQTEKTNYLHQWILHCVDSRAVLRTCGSEPNFRTQARSYCFRSEFNLRFLSIFVFECSIVLFHAF